MLNVGLRLEVGWLRGSKFVLQDAFDFELHGPEKWNCDNINNLLGGIYSNDEPNYAQLFFYYYAGKQRKFLVGSFRRVRLKNGDESWALTE